MTIKYYTYKRQAQAACLPGQKVEFKKGKGYYCYTLPVPTPPQGWVVDAPQDPKTTIINAPSIALNLSSHQGGVYKDYVIDGGGDSSVMLQNGTTGVLLQRFKITRINANPYSGNPSSPASHGVYCKAPSNQFDDFDIDGAGGHGANGFSMRMGGNIVTRSHVINLPGPYYYFEHDGVTREASIAYQGRWTFNGSAIYGDDSNGPPSPGLKQPFKFTQIDAIGNTDVFLDFRNYIGPGIWIDTCTINGKKIVASMIRGIPASKLSIR